MQTRTVIYTEKGWFCGLAPVYLADLDTELPCMMPRWWVPQWYLSLIEGLVMAFIYVWESIDPNATPAFVFQVTGEIKPFTREYTFDD